MAKPQTKQPRAKNTIKDYKKLINTANYTDIRQFLIKKQKEQEVIMLAESQCISSKVEESKDEFFSKFQAKTISGKVVEKQMLLTNQALKIHIPLQNIGFFGVFNSKPENPKTMLEKLKKLQSAQNQSKSQPLPKQKMSGIKKQKKGGKNKDGMTQLSLSRYLDKSCNKQTQNFNKRLNNNEDQKKQC